ncbi:MAG: SDR family oxidoreductase [Spirochaetia bacterium]|nr:SDR family oxidoreductase [Spirochaetia bacterium]
MGILKDKVIIITGASRGIGKCTALTLAREGAVIVVAAKTTQPNPKLPGTIQETVDEVNRAGGRGFGVKCNVRHLSELEKLVESVVKEFGRIDVLINNAGAIWVEPIENTPEKRFDLVMEVNFKAPFFLSQLCIPYMQKNRWGHILNMSPPVETNEAAGKIAYMTSKFGMTLLSHGLGGELKGTGVAANSLWPRTLVESLAVLNWGMGKPSDWRKADIMADAAKVILEQDPNTYTGRALIDEDVLREKGGVTDFDKYNVVPGTKPRVLDWNGLKDLMGKK